jgi:O-succinylbenzoate synthase
VTDILSLDATTLELASSVGFSILKIKITSAFEQELEILRSLRGPLNAFKVRFDFNQSFEQELSRVLLQRLSVLCGPKIDFVEDPCSFEPGAWTRLSPYAPMAIDQSMRDYERLSPAELKSAQVQAMIIKPALINPLSVRDLARGASARVVITSYLDHPVGQMGAACEAARFYSGASSETCGLLSQHAFESSAFTESMITRGPQLIAPTDFGIGFTQQLEKQKWQPL